MVLFIYYVVLAFDSVNKSYGVTIQLEPLQQHLYIVVVYFVCSSTF